MNNKSLINNIGLGILHYLALKTSSLEGDMAEFGVYKGGSAKIISDSVPDKTIHLFDTFNEGFPENDVFDIGHKKGEMAFPLTSVKKFLKGRKIKYHVGSFSKTINNIKNLKFSFVHMDADLYQSTKEGIKFFWDKIVDGGIIVFDDVICNDTPGVMKAIKELLPNEEMIIYGNSGHIYKNKCCSFDKIEVLKHCLTLFPEDNDISTTLMISLVNENKWNEVFKLHEKRIETSKDLKEFFSKFPQEKKWMGESLENKKLLVVFEQGAGDNIQYLRYAKLLNHNGTNINIANNHLALSPIIEVQNYINNVYNKKVINDYDYWCPLLSIPSLIYKENIPYSDCYIDIPEFYEYEKDFFNIGIVWAGTPGFANDKNRSCPLKKFAPIFHLKKTTIWSFQVDRRARVYNDDPNNVIDLSEHPDEWIIYDLSPYLGDWYETAKFLKKIDVLITVDTGILHLAGSMGVPTIAIMPYQPCWRWGQENKTPWYDSVTIVKQKNPGDWESLFPDVIKNIKVLNKEII